MYESPSIECSPLVKGMCLRYEVKTLNAFGDHWFHVWTIVRHLQTKKLILNVGSTQPGYIHKYIYTHHCHSFPSIILRRSCLVKYACNFKITHNVRIEMNKRYKYIYTLHCHSLPSIILRRSYLVKYACKFCISSKWE